MRLTCDLALKLDAKKLPPDVIVDPEVIRADLELLEFRLRNLSRFDGPIVKQLGKGVREIVEDQVVKKRDKLVSKINRQIDKNRDKLRLSLHDMVKSKWGGLVSKTLERNEKEEKKDE